MLTDHLTEEQIDSIVLEPSMTEHVFEHLFECDACFAAHENTCLLVIALNLERGTTKNMTAKRE